ncbi:MAG: type II toxin-antitoxin system VapC family toxin [Bacteroidota bacterium]|nr:type II toxin-antitoxin system VapC family toxin [Bacteroidota bacterium]
MNGNNILLDTNIVLYLLNGEETLIPLLEEKNLFLSFITQLELLGNRNIEPNDILKIKQFISECTVIDISPGIKEFTISIRQKYSVKLPDCIIMATSLWLNMPLITADQDFKKIDIADLIFFKR